MGFGISNVRVVVDVARLSIADSSSFRRINKLALKR
jgi:hypothetical protein